MLIFSWMTFTNAFENWKTEQPYRTCKYIPFNTHVLRKCCCLITMVMGLLHCKSTTWYNNTSKTNHRVAVRRKPPNGQDGESIRISTILPSKHISLSFRSWFPVFYLYSFSSGLFTAIVNGKRRLSLSVGDLGRIFRSTNILAWTIWKYRQIIFIESTSIPSQR